MSHPLFWPSKTFFYPIGNTAAVSLTQDLSPEQSADILLLGCGDPRNILFTLFADVNAPTRPRKLDVTCCDLEPAILARNTLLFALLEAKEPIDQIWNIFYHFKIDTESSKTLALHSKQLYDRSETTDAWQSAPCGSFLKFVDHRTMNEVRHHWKNYAEFPNISTARLTKLHKQQNTLSESITKQQGVTLSPSRAAGMLWVHASSSVDTMFRRYWETGTLFTRDSDIKAANRLNPTFVYAYPGEVFNPHYGTFPQGFHLMPAMVPFSSEVSSSVRVQTAIFDLMKKQFNKWANSFHTSRTANAITIRFYSGEALAFCRALDIFATAGNPATGVFVSAWRGAQINFDEPSDPPAPTIFDVIDTSNLTDHLGLINILLAAGPLLKEKPASQSVLYTETLLSAGKDATKSFLDRIFTTVPTIATLLGLAPRAYVSSFTSHSNTHELLSPERTKQYHERVAWIDPSGPCRYTFGLYSKMFANGLDITTMFSRPSLAKFKSMIDVHYHRETIAALMHRVKRRVQIHSGDWDHVVNEFLERLETDTSHMLENVYYQDMCLQLHLFDIHTVPTLKPDWRPKFAANPSSGIFRDWPDVPAVLCVVMTVPRKSFDPFFEDKDKTGTPTIKCHLNAKGIHSTAYSSSHVVWGKCSNAQGANLVTIEEDSQGIFGTSDLVVMFWASSRVLEFQNTSVLLALKSTPHSAPTFMTKLGMELAIFSAKIEDQKHVKILPYRPSVDSHVPLRLGPLASSSTPITTNPLSFLMAVTGSGDSAHGVVSFTAHVDIDSPVERKVLLSGVEVQATQIAPCTMKMSVGKHDHIVSYPYPIMGSAYKLRVARKSHYVEVIVPASEPLDSGGYHCDYAPIVRNSTYTPWNIHHLSIGRMPKIEATTPKKLDWLNSHTALQLSDRERDIRLGDETRKEASINALINVKDTIHALTMNFSGVQGTKTRTIGLCEPDDGGVYAILLLGALRLDLASFTVIIDVALVPLSNERMPALMPHIAKIQDANPMVQVHSLYSGRTRAFQPPYFYRELYCSI
ncbi:MYND Zn-finger protein [Ceratobasidium sp. AG-Ba]|nr:MYND Zn-finger protein [Ceratobasidium sp. AG-Ba]